MKRFYLLAMIIGTIIPWYFFFTFFQQNGFDLGLFLGSGFVNNAAGGFSADLVISIIVFWVWSFYDSRRNAVRMWWVVIPATLAVGLSLSMPLWFYLRHKD